MGESCCVIPFGANTNIILSLSLLSLPPSLLSLSLSLSLSLCLSLPPPPPSQLIEALESFVTGTQSRLRNKLLKKTENETGSYINVKPRPAAMAIEVRIIINNVHVYRYTL